MRKRYNEVFGKLLKEYNLPEDLSFEIDFPKDIKKMLKYKIVNNTRGITLKSFGILPRVNTKGKRFMDQYHRKKTYIEDSYNHFHCDDEFRGDARKSFMLGIKTLIALAQKFEQEKIKGIRFWHFFQNAELNKQWEIHNNFFEKFDKNHVHDRLSFFTRRKGEEVIKIDNEGQRYESIFIIDI